MRESDLTWWHLHDLLVDEQNRSLRLGSMLVSLVRMRFRNGFEKESLLRKDTGFNVSINLREIGHTFLTGHRIRPEVTSSFYPLISANTNTGNPIATDTAELSSIKIKVKFILCPQNNFKKMIKDEQPNLDGFVC